MTDSTKTNKTNKSLSYLQAEFVDEVIENSNKVLSLDAVSESAATVESNEILPSFSSTLALSLFDDKQMSTLRLLIEHLAESVFMVNLEGKIEFANAKAAQLLGCAKAGLIGVSWQKFLAKSFQGLYQEMVNSHLSNKLPIHHEPKEMTLVDIDGRSKYVELSISYLPTATPRFVLIMRDLSHHRAECEALRLLATTDGLTQLANRRYFDEALLSHWQECRAKHRPVAVVIIDVDHFKVFNDQFGHLQGDECLRKIADAISAVVPKETGMGLACRYGGEEFALILPNHNAQMARVVAGMIQRNINNLSFTDLGLGEHVSVSVSQGIASEVNGQFRTPEALLCAADTALYRAKSEGRDRVNLSC